MTVVVGSLDWCPKEQHIEFGVLQLIILKSSCLLEAGKFFVEVEYCVYP